MTFQESISKLTSPLDLLEESARRNASRFLARAVKFRGFYPASEEFIESLRANLSTSNLTVDRIAVEMHADPVMALRLISLVNHSFYARGREITTLPGAVGHVGLMKLPQIVSDFSKLQARSRFYIGRAVSLNALAECLYTAEIARFICEKENPRSAAGHYGYLIGAFSQMGRLLLAYCKPNLYAACLFHEGPNTRRNRFFERNFKRLTDHSSGEFGSELGEELSLPAVLRDAVKGSDIAPWNRRRAYAGGTEDIRQGVKAAYIAQRIAHEICHCRGAAALEVMVRELSSKSFVKSEILMDALGETPPRVVEHLEKMGLVFDGFPDYIRRYTDSMVDDEGNVTDTLAERRQVSDRIAPYVNELKVCFKIEDDTEFSRVPQAILCTLQALVIGLDFDRAFYFKYDQGREELIETIPYGEELPGRKPYLRDATTRGAAEAECIATGEVTFRADPIDSRFWPFVSIPVFWKGQPIGVFYADRRETRRSSELDTVTQMSLTALGEMWREVPERFC